MAAPRKQNPPRPAETDRERRRRDEDEIDRRDHGDPQLRAARARERGRMLAILRSPAGRAHPALAAHVAFKMVLPRRAAIRFIGEMGALIAEPTDAPTLAARIVEAGDRARAGLGSLKLPPKPSALAAQIIAAGKKRRGEI